MKTLWFFLREKLLAHPGVGRIRDRLLASGHTSREADVGGIAAALLQQALLWVLVWTFLGPTLARAFRGAVAAARAHPTEAVLIGFFGGAVALALFFRALQVAEERRRRKSLADRRRLDALMEKKRALERGAMGSFGEVYRWIAGTRHPEIQLWEVRALGTRPLVRFRARRFPADAGLSKFRDALFADAWNLLREAFLLSPNIPEAVVEGLHEYIDRQARFYEGAILSVRASRRDFEEALARSGASPFQILTSLDLRYNETREVQPHPPPEDPSARILERLRREQPRLELSYGRPEDSAVPPQGLFVEEEPAAPEPAARAAAGSRQVLSDPEALEAYPALRFQEFVLALLKRWDLAAMRVRRAAAGGVVVSAENPHPLLGGRFLVWGRQVAPDYRIPLETLKEFSQMMEAEFCPLGILLSTGGFTPEASAAARSLGIRLLDRTSLLALKRSLEGEGAAPSP